MKKKYVKEYVPDEKGQYQYHGRYYVSRLSEEEQKKAGLIQTGYGIVTCLLVFLALAIPCQGNRTIYVVMPMELSLIGLVYCLAGNYALYRCKGKTGRMEQKDYDKMYQSPMQALTIVILLCLFSIGGQIIGMFTKALADSREDICFCMIQLLMLVISVIMWNRKRKEIRQVEEIKKA